MLHKWRKLEVPCIFAFICWLFPPVSIIVEIKSLVYDSSISNNKSDNFEY